METLCLIQLNESQKVCLYCMAVIFATEKAWETKNGRHFCCWECVEEYDKLQHTY